MAERLHYDYSINGKGLTKTVKKIILKSVIIPDFKKS